MYRLVQIGLASTAVVTLGCGRLDSDDRRTRGADIPKIDDGAASGEEFDFVLFDGRWENRAITYSFMPDGTLGGSLCPQSDLIGKYDAAYPRDVWQGEIRRAFAAWASLSKLTFTEVSDDGSPHGIAGSKQGDPRFGDIRIGGCDVGSGNLGTAFPPTSLTSGGDFFFNTRMALPIGSIPDLASVAMHELGHALGFAHPGETAVPQEPGIGAIAVMNGGNWGVYIGPNAYLLDGKPGPYPDDVLAMNAAYPELRPAADTTPPAVSFTGPTGSVKKGTSVQLTAAATDNVGVIKVEIYVKSALLCSRAAAPYTCNWSVPTTGGKTTAYTATATAYDAAGNKSTATLKINAVK